MSQEQLLILLLKIVLISGFVSVAGWVMLYSALAAWWRNPIGRTLVIKSCLIALLLVPSALSLFFSLTRQDSMVVAWADVVLIGLITPVMLWRCAVWIKIYRQKSDRTGRDVL